LGAAYLIFPAIGWGFDAASLAAAFGTLPLLAKVGIKSFVAFPFAFHALNGLRHLTWDSGTGMERFVEDSDVSTVEKAGN
jgi:succinate dehydrogenase (ubiquinone) cytochrome b560 subunit